VAFDLAKARIAGGSVHMGRAKAYHRRRSSGRVPPTKGRAQGKSAKISLLSKQPDLPWQPTRTHDVSRSGVDIDAGDALVERIKPFAKRTMASEVLGGIGGFGALVEVSKKYKRPVMVSGTDGVGTKLKLAFRMKKHDTRRHRPGGR